MGLRMADLDDLMAFAVTLADESAKVILPLWKHTVTESKPDGSDVTEADRGAEQRIREMIAAKYPEHGIIGEEFGTDGGGRDHRWVIDPIDGTAGFALGLPLFGTLIALLEGDEPVVGVINLPALGEMVYAAKGLGCWYRVAGGRPERASVGRPVSLGRAYVSTTGGHNSDIEVPGAPYSLITVARRARRFRFGGDCAQHALVCRGRLDAAIDTEMKPWDTAALVPCVEEAGGMTTTIEGERKGIVFGGSLVSSSGEPLHSGLLAALRGGEPAPV
jgi:histidinol-phosphatase